jgi:signal transduction histidine kinase
LAVSLGCAKNIHLGTTNTATSARVDSILAEREARGLRVPVVIRLLLALLIIPSILGPLNRIEGYDSIRTIFLAMMFGWVALNIYFFALLHKRRHVALIGLVGSLLDVAFIAAQLGVGVVAMADMQLPPTAIFKTQLPAFGVALVSINALALRPRYPLIVGVGCFAALAISLAVAMGDPAFVLSTRPADYLAGPAAGASELINLFLLYVFVTAAVVFMTHVARKTIRQTIAQELEAAELQRKQLQIVMREKVEALAKLVAGVSHELNSPLGVIQSGLGTQATALDKLAAKLTDDDGKLVGRVRSISESMTEAVVRISSTAESLRSFAHLDEAEFQKVDLQKWIERVLERHAPPADKHIEVQVTAGDVPDLYANAGELTQALATILQNAFDAIDDEGTVEIRIDSTTSVVTFANSDSGRGIAPNVMATLFDVALRPGRKRVAASFGLPAAQSVAHRHGGHISVDSEVRRGSTFTIHIPIEA